MREDTYLKMYVGWCAKCTLKIIIFTSIPSTISKPTSLMLMLHRQEAEPLLFPVHRTAGHLVLD